MTVTYLWRGDVTNGALSALHAEAFGPRLFDDADWDWKDLLSRYSLGWIVARDDTRLVGFVNVVWDGFVHAWIQDTMVAADIRGQGIGTELVGMARRAARDAGCEWLHVDFAEHLGPFYYGACGFTPTRAGVIALQQ